MKIIILGAGQVGGTLAENLAREDNDITLVDTNHARLQELQNRLDIRTITGQASYPDILAQAGADTADMLIAVTSNDETNMVACQVAFTLFNTPKKIARIRSPHYLHFPRLFAEKALPIDVCINPEQLVTHHVTRLIENPGALQVLDFANGNLQLVAVRPARDAQLLSKPFSSLPDELPEIDFRIVALFRDKQSIALKGKTTIEYGDEVFFIAAQKYIPRIMEAVGRLDRPYHRLMIAGGGHIGARLARTLEDSYQVKVIERDAARTQWLAKELDNTTVLLGEVGDKDLLLDENIEYTDVFCAVTNDDEANIMAAVQAKRLGVRKVMALISRTAYVDLIEGSDIDIAISPQQITISYILRYLRKGDIVNVHSLRRGAAEAIEAVAHGDPKTSKVVGRKISAIKLPKNTVIGAIVREDEVIIAHHDLVIEADDHVVLFMSNKNHSHQVEKLFSVRE